MKLKVCGMKYNPVEVAAMEPDYLGFIFWSGSQRNFEGPLPEGISGSPGRIGVFVDPDPGEVLSRCSRYGLSGVQLHGEESPAFCRDLRKKLAGNLEPVPELIKAFAVGTGFDFGRLEPYLDSCDYFLFDSRGPLPGGNGTGFNWKLLRDYPYEKPFFLSGGIGPDSTGALRRFLGSRAGAFCHAVDVNSKFELEPGNKDTGSLRSFMDSGLFKQPDPDN